MLIMDCIDLDREKVCELVCFCSCVRVCVKRRPFDVMVK